MIVAGSESVMVADVVIIATGLQPDPPEWLAAHGITLEANGRIQVRHAPTYKQRTNSSTSVPCQASNTKLFAGGADARGADLVVIAARSGGGYREVIAQRSPPSRVAFRPRTDVLAHHVTAASWSLLSLLRMP